MAKSVQSAATTRGGVDFDDLVSGKVPPYYTFRPTRIKNKQDVCAAMPTKKDIKHTATNTEDYNNALYRATDTLVKWVDDTIRDIEIQSEKKVVKFYIGKTYVRKSKKSKVFDTMNPNTWRKEGIRSRWCHHKHQDYGRNGMVVLTVVTKDDVPQQSIPVFKHQEMYALALEQQLIIHYAFIRGDERLANISTQPGMQQQQESKAIGYPIYMAFALDDSETDHSNESDMEELGEETAVTKLQSQVILENQENLSYMAASELSASLLGRESHETLQLTQDRSGSDQRHVHFSNMITKHDYTDHVTEPESSMQNRGSSNDDRIDLTQSSVKHAMTRHSSVTVPNHPSNIFVKRKRRAIEIHEESTCRKEKRLDEQQLTTSKQQYSGNEISLVLSYIVQITALLYNIQTSLIGCVILRYYKLFFHATLS